jgi:hypothetical protein
MADGAEKRVKQEEEVERRTREERRKRKARGGEELHLCQDSRFKLF